jgi:phospholipid/cholesterol/gamma-HCH transport system substrate-binding protein
MTANRRNFLVGVTVLGGLFVLARMILKFSGQSARLFAEKQFAITFVVPRADGLAEGSPILYRGVDVGQVTGLRRAENQREVIVEANIDEKPPLPANLEGTVRLQALLGAGAGINLELTDEDPRGELKPGAQLKAKYVGLDLIPPEFASLARDLEETSRQFRESGLIDNLNKTVTSAGKTMDSVDKLVSDPAMRENIEVTLKNLRTASESATRIGADLEKITGNLDEVSVEATATIKEARENVNKLSGQMSDRLEQVAKLLENFQSISAKVNEGQGTAGLLVNDPKLYESLVDTSQELNATITDLKRLVEQWEQEGVALKLR